MPARWDNMSLDGTSQVTLLRRGNLSVSLSVSSDPHQAESLATQRFQRCY